LVFLFRFVSGTRFFSLPRRFQLIFLPTSAISSRCPLTQPINPVCLLTILTTLQTSLLTAGDCMCALSLVFGFFFPPFGSPHPLHKLLHSELPFPAFCAEYPHSLMQVVLEFDPVEMNVAVQIFPFPLFGTEVFEQPTPPFLPTVNPPARPIIPTPTSRLYPRLRTFYSSAIIPFSPHLFLSCLEYPPSDRQPTG